VESFHKLLHPMPEQYNSTCLNPTTHLALYAAILNLIVRLYVLIEQVLVNDYIAWNGINNR